MPSFVRRIAVQHRAHEDLAVGVHGDAHHDLLEVGPVLFAVAVRQEDRGRRPRIRRRIIPEERKGGGVGMTKGVTGRLHGSHAGAQDGEERGAVRCEILQDAPQRVTSR